MSDLSLWLLFVAVGLGTFAIRLSFVELHGKLRLPPLLTRALAYVPASVLAALVLPAVIYPDGHGDISLSNPQVPAALVAAWIAWKTRSTLFTLVAGMGALWLLKVLPGLG